MNPTRRDFLLAIGTVAIVFPAANAEEKPDFAKVVLPPKGKDEVHYNFEKWADKEGKPLTAEDIKGKLLIIYGGYPECAGVCPGAARNLVAAIKKLKKDSPDLAAKVAVVVVIIRNNEGDTLDKAKARARKWQTEGLEGEKTGIRVLVSDSQAVLDDFMGKFRIQYKDGENSTLIHSPWAYMFDGKGKMLQDSNGTYKAGMIQTQTGSEPILQKIYEHFGVKNPDPAPSP